MGASLLAVAKSIYQRIEWMHTLKAGDKIIMEPLKSCREEGLTAEYPATYLHVIE